MGRIAVKIENLSKRYRLGAIGTGTLSHDLKRLWTVGVMGKEDPYLKIDQTVTNSNKKGGDYIWALKGISLEIRQGDVFGIIGKNGAGKSTLLKILSRVTKPTTGSIRYRGRIASLLEVGTGFHPEMTGRENIYMNGSIMGMTRNDISLKLDEIVDFAGVKRYIDTPVKRYSSGMTVRLGFSIAAHIEPDILVVDEVLAVGDAEFQNKAIGKMHDVSKENGRTVLFVSHNMGAIKNLCSKSILLDHGEILLNDSTEKVIDKYLSFNSQIKKIYDFDLHQNKIAYVQKVIIENENGDPSNEFLIGEPWQIRVFVCVNNYIPDFIIGMGMSNSMNIPIRTVWQPKYNAGQGIYEVVFKEKQIILSSSVYNIFIGLSSKNNTFDYIKEQVFLSITDAISPKLKSNIIDGKNGLFLNDLEMSITKIK